MVVKQKFTYNFYGIYSNPTSDTMCKRILALLEHYTVKIIITLKISKKQYKFLQYLSIPYNETYYVSMYTNI
jgi:predicted Fe-Mo cluster-binding NifX family protein